MGLSNDFFLLSKFLRVACRQEKSEFFFLIMMLYLFSG